MNKLISILSISLIMAFLTGGAFAVPCEVLPGVPAICVDISSGGSYRGIGKPDGNSGYNKVMVGAGGPMFGVKAGSTVTCTLDADKYLKIKPDKGGNSKVSSWSVGDDKASKHAKASFTTNRNVDLPQPNATPGNHIGGFRFKPSESQDKQLSKVDLNTVNIQINCDPVTGPEK